MFLICQPYTDPQIAAYLWGRYAQGRMAVIVFPDVHLCRVVVMTLERHLFSDAVQLALEAGAWVEKLKPWDGCLCVVVPADRALPLAWLFSSIPEGGRRIGRA